MKTLKVIVCLSAALVLASGCDSSEENNSNTDAASSTDTAVSSDAGTPADTAVPSDAAAPADTAAPSDAAGETSAWEAPCVDDSDCAAPTDWCAKMPGETDGYCTIHCANGNADCTYEDWTCNAVGGCDNADLTWCGPPEEIENGQGFLVMCE